MARTLRNDTRHSDGAVVFIAVVQAVAWLLPLFTLKENRVVSGSALYSWHLFPAVLCIALPGALCALLLYAARTERRRRAFAIYATVAIAQAAIGCIAVALSAAHTAPLGANARIGLNFGFWIMLFSAVGIVYAAIGRSPYRASKWVMPAIAIIYALCIAAGLFSHVGIYLEFVNNRSRFVRELLNHLFLTFFAVGTATVIGIPLGIFAWRRERLGNIVFPFVNGIQTIPSLALFGLIIGPLSIITRAFPLLRTIGIKGIGNTPALIALSMYALLPIVQNTYSGLANISHSVIDAGTAMGMNRRQLWKNVEFPLSFALIFNGFRTATVQTVGNATVAALIGASGLGNFIFRGLGAAAADLILLGVIPIVAISILLDNTLLRFNHLYQKYALHRRQLV